ncbi:MBL fold metallo-hydrolase [Anabaena sp. CA = ATCC 33047]|uniref:MBL fold metallo-hydrolase n=1 Tax=Anabaena sp. (strain CA / ATCC 33047) TaxID=52271 RepID=UPI000833C577|nr:MBL fold metallo-hydrolase [Anabaena sp. CA = ATCC 33047]
MYLTWLDSNSWLLEIGEQRILIDPWLVGSLIFGNLDWFFKGFRSQDRPIPDNIDLILLSQGLEDHAHTPTLKQLNRSIRVVASPNAAKVVKELGYTSVTTLAHGESYKLNNQVEITAVPGSPIGPTLIENAYVLKELGTDLKLYYEPHGYHAPELKQFAPIDVVITPLIDINLPLVGSIIRGQQKALEVAEWLKPQVMLPTASPGDVSYEGLLVKFLKPEGNVEELRSQLAKRQLSTQIIEPQPGDRLQLPLEQRRLAV